jgi:hypothetical protein
VAAAPPRYISNALQAVSCALQRGAKGQSSQGAGSARTWSFRSWAPCCGTARDCDARPRYCHGDTKTPPEGGAVVRPMRRLTRVVDKPKLRPLLVYHLRSLKQLAQLDLEALAQGSDSGNISLT